MRDLDLAVPTVIPVIDQTADHRLAAKRTVAILPSMSHFRRSIRDKTSSKLINKTNGQANNATHIPQKNASRVLNFDRDRSSVTKIPKNTRPIAKYKARYGFK
jgi:hypothetical protein